jgi:hypothetical protein
MLNRVTAVFDSQQQAEQAVSSLRSMGVSDAHLSFVSKHNNELAGDGGAHDGHSAGDDAAKGLAAGAGAGALFGIAAALIPGVGPFITAGTLLTSALGAVGGGAVAGALVGGTTGAIAGALSHAGYDESEANYYGGAVESGGVLVAVDTTGSSVSTDQVRSVLAQHGGRFYGA